MDHAWSDQSQPDLVSTMLNVFNKFEVNPLVCLSGDVWTPWKCNRWTDRRMDIRMNGRTSPFLRQWRIWHQVYLSSPGQIIVRYPITIKLSLRKVLVPPWSRYDDNVFEIINNLAWTNGVWFCRHLQIRFCLKSLFFKFHWIMIMIALLIISQHWFR